jgi:hypothetical protein
MDVINFVCWNCSKPLKASVVHAGKKCKCSKCDNVNTIPTVAGLPRNVTKVQTVPAPDEPSPLDELDEAVGAPDPDSEYVPLLQSKHFKEYRLREPWYFKIIEAWSYFNIALGLLFFVGIFIAFAVELAEHAKELGFRRAFALSLAVYINWIIGVFGFLASWAFMLLILDAARNLRGIRHAAMRMTEQSN